MSLHFGVTAATLDVLCVRSETFSSKLAEDDVVSVIHGALTSTPSLRSKISCVENVYGVCPPSLSIRLPLTLISGTKDVKHLSRCFTLDRRCSTSDTSGG